MNENTLKVPSAEDIARRNSDTHLSNKLEEDQNSDVRFRSNSLVRPRSNDSSPIRTSSNRRSRLWELKVYDDDLKLSSSRDKSPSKTHSEGLSGAFSMMSGGDKLAQEIHEEFLCCKICLEPFKKPKCLACLHTFCEQCIESHIEAECTYKKYSDYREFTCPLCRKRTQLPIGGVKKLADNFLVSNLTELVDRQKPSKYPFCEICKMVNKRHREAVSKCLDCVKLLCKTCVDWHKETKVTKHHSIFDIEIEKDIECKEHKEEIVRFYCEPCETCICVLCTFNEHRDHEVTQFQEAVGKYKDSIGDMLSVCKGKIDTLEDQLKNVEECEEIMRKAEELIRDTAIEYISEIRNTEKLLIQELNNIYGAELMEMIEHRVDMKANLESLKSTCNLTDIILRGKDIELLLLNKQVKEKLGGLEHLQVKTLPSTISECSDPQNELFLAKKVKFVPGTLEFGHIHDDERPLLSKLGSTFRHSKAEEESLIDTEVQTEDKDTEEQDAQTENADVDEKEIQTEQDEEEEMAQLMINEEEPKTFCDEETQTEKEEEEEDAPSPSPPQSRSPVLENTYYVNPIKKLVKRQKSKEKESCVLA